VRDITLHEEVMDVVMGLGPPAGTAESANRVKRVAKWFKWEEEKLWLTGDLDREVPPIGARANLIAAAAR
jgi:hypothetical protein